MARTVAYSTHYVGDKWRLIMELQRVTDDAVTGPKRAEDSVLIPTFFDALNYAARQLHEKAQGVKKENENG